MSRCLLKNQRVVRVAGALVAGALVAGGWWRPGHMTGIRAW